MEQLKSPALKKLFALLPVRKRPGKVDAMKTAILQIPIKGVQSSDADIKIRAAALFNTKSMDINQIKRHLVKIGEEGSIFELMPQTAETWYPHILATITQNNLLPFVGATASASGMNRQQSAPAAVLDTQPVITSVVFLGGLKKNLKNISHSLKIVESSGFQALQSIRKSINKATNDVTIYGAMMKEINLPAAETVEQLEAKLIKYRKKYDATEESYREYIENILIELPEYTGKESMPENIEEMCGILEQTNFYLEVSGDEEFIDKIEKMKKIFERSKSQREKLSKRQLENGSKRQRENEDGDDHRAEKRSKR